MGALVYEEDGGLPDSESYCGFYSNVTSSVSIATDAELASGETRTYDLSGVIEGELPESAVAQATADAAAPIWSGSFHIMYTPDDLYRCKGGLQRTVFWTDVAIEGCTDVIVGTRG